jgi:hypothetical protein
MAEFRRDAAKGRGLLAERPPRTTLTEAEIIRIAEFTTPRCLLLMMSSLLSVLLTRKRFLGENGGRRSECEAAVR